LGRSGICFYEDADKNRLWNTFVGKRTVPGSSQILNYPKRLLLAFSELYAWKPVNTYRPAGAVPPVQDKLLNRKYTCQVFNVPAHSLWRPLLLMNGSLEIHPIWATPITLELRLASRIPVQQAGIPIL
jgi:hypothetical protein